MTTKNISRRNFLKLIGTAGAGAVLAACAAETAVPEEPAVEEPAVEEPATEPEPTAEPPKEEAVEINYHFLAWGPMQDVDMVAAEMSKITQEKINTTLKLVPMDWSAFNEKLQLSLAAGEPIDTMFTCTWANNFYANVSNGNLLPLDDLIPENAPGFWASIPEKVWGAGKVGGKLYGAINQQIWAMSVGFNIRKDIAEESGIDVTQFKTFEDHEPFNDWVKANKPDMFPTGWFAPDEKQTYWPTVWGQDDFGLAVGVQPYVVMNSDDANLKTDFSANTEGFSKAIDIARRWYLAGYLPAEPTSGEDFVAGMKAGLYAMVPTNNAKPGRDSEDKAKYGFDFHNVRLTGYAPPLISTGSVAATMNGLARTCKDPARAAKFFELLNTDVDLYNLICKGVQGTHWVWADEAKKVIQFPEGVTAETSTYNPNTDWMFGNQFNAYYVDMVQADDNVWQQTKDLNDSAAVSEAMGFAFIQDAVTNEIAQITTVVAEIGVPLSQGRTDPAEALPQYQQKIKDVGGDVFLAELQKQLDEWKATK